MNNLETIKKKLNLLSDHMEDGKIYNVGIDRSFAEKYDLAKSAKLNKLNVDFFIGDVGRLNIKPEIIIWWLYSCNEIWKQVRRRKGKK